MKLLPKKQREAMYAIYSFCREVDDIADEEGTADEKIRKLNIWKEEIENIYAGKNAKTNIGKAILEIKDEYSLRKKNFRINQRK
jgi:phytoene synthase